MVEDEQEYQTAHHAKKKEQVSKEAIITEHAQWLLITYQLQMVSPAKTRPISGC